MESNPFRVIPLLSISSPRRGNLLFQVQGAPEKTAHLEADFEEAGLWLEAFFGHNMY